MAAVFLKLLNMSVAAGWLILAVVILRLALKKAPKWITCALWGAAALRLVCPFLPESALSLVPSAEPVSRSVIDGNSFTVAMGAVGAPLNEYPGGRYFEGVVVPADAGVNVMTVLGWVWLAGVIAMAVYAAASYLRLRRRVGTAVRLEGGVYQSEAVDSPFVLGVFRPRIYLPFNMDGGAAECVVAHEKAHIARRDHWWKPLGFLILSVYWFAPLVWLAYVLLCRDIEAACDQRVVRGLSEEDRREYARALLDCGARRRAVAACPLAFGEVGVKARVKNVLNYKKPAFWLVLLAVLASAAVAVCFLTDPKSAPDEPADVAGDLSGRAVSGVYEFDGCLYSSPYLSYYPVNGTGLRYRLEGASVAYLDEVTGDVKSVSGAESVRVEEVDVSAWDGLFLTEPPDISAYSSRLWYEVGEYARAYLMDGEVWLAEMASDGQINRLYRLKPAEGQPAVPDAGAMLRLFTDYTDVYVYEAVPGDWGAETASYADVIDGKEWRVIGSDGGFLGNDPDYMVRLTDAGGRQVFFWDDTDVAVIVDGPRTWTVSCGKSVAEELMPWALARQAELLSAEAEYDPADMPAFIAALPDFYWFRYARVYGQEAAAGLLSALYDYVAENGVTEEQRDCILRGGNGLDGAYAEGYEAILDTLNG